MHPPKESRLMELETLQILIADDHPVVLRGLRALLTTHDGWKVCGAAQNGKDTVKLVKQLKPDILITDISMPGMNGFEVIRQVHDLDPHIGILTLTMHDTEPMLRGAMEAGAHAYVLKSELDNRLIEAVEALCEGRAFFSPGISNLVMKSFSKGPQPEFRDPAQLTPRQRQVLKLIASGKSNKEVAAELGISTRTAEAHRYQIMNRLKVRTLSELVIFAVRNHMIEL